MPSIKSVEIEIREEKNQATARVITSRVRQFTMKRSLIDGDTSLKLDFVAENLNSEDATVFDGKVKEFKVAMNRDDKTISTDWIPFVIAKHKMSYVGTMPVLSIVARGLSYLMRLHSRWRSFSDVYPSTPIMMIAQKYRMTTFLSSMQGKGTWLQTGESDWEFLSRLSSEVSSGNKKVWLYVDGRNLIVKTLDHAAVASRSFGIGTGDDRIDEMKFHHNGLEVSEIGGNTMRYSGYDPLMKKYLEFSPLDSMHQDYANKLSFDFNSSSEYRTTPHQSLDFVRQSALSNWNDVAAKFFAFQATTIGDVGIKPFDVIEISAVGSSGDSSVMNGRYPVYEVIHHYNGIQEENSSTGLTTTIGGFRRCFHFGEIKSSSASTSVVATKDDYFTGTKETVKIAKEIKTASAIDSFFPKK